MSRYRRGGSGLGYLIAFGLGIWFAKKNKRREIRCEVHREHWNHPPEHQHGPWCHGPWCHERRAGPPVGGPPAGGPPPHNT